MSSSFTLFAPLVRTGYFTDRDGVANVCQRYDEITTLNIDWTDQLASGETVSSISYSASGPTTSSASLASPISTVTVTGSGELEITATLSTGRKLQRVVRYVEPQTSDESEDYGE